MNKWSKLFLAVCPVVLTMSSCASVPAGTEPMVPKVTYKTIAPTADTSADANIPVTPTAASGVIGSPGGQSSTAPTATSGAVVPPNVDASALATTKKHDCKKEKCIALTVDDGPAGFTSQTLKIMRNKGIKVTFFMLGKQVGYYKDLTAKIAAEGHEIGSHSWDHPQFHRMSKAQIKQQLSRSTKLIEQVTGEKVTLMRPPYGQTNATVRGVAKSLGEAQILWSIDPEDWKYRNADKVVNAVVNNARRGDIILTHDLYKSTIDAYPRIIDKLKKKGFVFVTVSELFNGNVKAGKSYSQDSSFKKKKK